MDYDVVQSSRPRNAATSERAAVGARHDARQTRRSSTRPCSGVRRLDHAAVVASQGHYDEHALESVLKSERPVCRPRGVAATRGDTVRAAREQGVPGVATIRNPAGLDLGARTSPEVALSILAEIVQVPRADRGPRKRRNRCSGPRDTCRRRRAVDPGVRHEVNIATARHTAGFDGVDILLLLRELPDALRHRAAAISRAHHMTDASTIRARFRERGFIVDDAFATALQIMLALEKPLLVEGPAGVGKTESAKSLRRCAGHAADSSCSATRDWMP